MTTIHNVNFPDLPQDYDFNGGEYSIDDYSGNFLRIITTTDKVTKEPWKEHDLYGVVSEGKSSDVKKDDIILHQDGDHVVYYKYAENFAQIKTQTWRDQNALDKDTISDELAKKAINEDVSRLRAWYAGKWKYETITAEICDQDGHVLEKTSSIGVDSDALDETKADLISDMARDLMTTYPIVKESQISSLRAKAERLESSKK